MPEPDQVRRIFASISQRYDLANRVLSLGLDQRWRRSLIKGALASTPRPRDVLDLACGTGDVTLALRRTLDQDASITGCDFSSEMLSMARAKANSSAPPQGKPIQWVEGDATALPFAAESFDLVTIAFGLRNVADRARTLSEMHRVLRPGGTAAILEFGDPEGSGLAKAIQLLNRVWLGLVGGAVTGHGWAYRYLSSSSERFPGRQTLSTEARTQLPGCEVRSGALFPGICYLVLITRPQLR
jgi:demethylmenaquinone methyltransferase/2-methoxy-6-polyprenyl-1,4-benzoquinol methylase